MFVRTEIEIHFHIDIEIDCGYNQSVNLEMIFILEEAL